MDITSIMRLGVARKAATRSAIDQLTDELGPIPDELISLLEATNGFLTPGGIHVYSTDDIVERNETYEIADYCEGYILIGDNSGGRGFLMQRQLTSNVVASDLGDLSIAGFEIVGHTLREWLHDLQ